MDAVMNDLRFALRYFSRHKTSTAIIVAVLTLGTGANILIFSFVQALFLRPAPAVPEDNSYVRLWSRERATPTSSWRTRQFTQQELQSLAERRDVFSAVAGWIEHDVVLQSADSVGARGVGAQFVTPNYFSALGVRLIAGAGFTQVDATAGGSLTAVLSQSMAEQLYGTAIGAVGREVLVNEVPLRVVGVAPPQFQGALRDMDDPVLWIPVNARADVARVPSTWMNDQAAISLFARLSPDASRAQATATVQQVKMNTLPDSAARVGMTRIAEALSLNAPPPGSSGGDTVTEMTMVALMGALILLIAWMNVSSLMVSAAVARRHEIAVRLSLGASRFRLLRQLVTESIVLALTGGALGLLIVWWVMVWITKTASNGVDLAPDAGTFAFVLAIAVLSGVLFGLSPALHATRGAVASAVRDSGAGATSRSRLQRGFVVAQIALSQPLLVILALAILEMRSDYRPLAPEMSRHVITIGFRPLMQTGAAGQRAEAVDSLIPRIAALPEVVAAAPETQGFGLRRVSLPSNGSDSLPTILTLEGTAPGWFSIVDAPIILGRDVALSDSVATDYPIVIGADLARALFGEVSPIGRTLPSPAIPELDQDSISMTVIGVYDASKRLPGMSWSGSSVRGSMTDISTRVFTARDMQWRRDRVVVRTRALASPFVPRLYQFVRDRAPSLPVTSMRTLADEDRQSQRESMVGLLFAGAGGALALLLASLGLYGVVSLAVRQRTREIGIRIAVGATPQTVRRSFLFSGVKASVVALALGLPLSIVGLKLGLSEGMIIAPGVNPLLIGIVIAPILLGVAAAATWLPARRASLVDPATTLRIE